jgi:hypothetical protein
MYGNLQALNGQDVARWLVANPRLCPRKVLIHSWNGVGAKRMEQILGALPGIEVVLRQFRAPGAPT